jgi:hypothetical protein
MLLHNHVYLAIPFARKDEVLRAISHNEYCHELYAIIHKREHAVRIIQSNCKKWLEKSTCKDGKYGIMFKLTLDGFKNDCIVFKDQPDYK